MLLLSTTPLAAPPFMTFGQPFGSRFGYQIRAADTPEGKERVRAFYEALGRFVAMYARAESSMHSALCYYAKPPDGISKALFSGVRVRQATDFIRRIMEVTGADKSAINEFTEYSAQLSAITTARDAILHHGAQSVAEGRGFVSDEARAHLPCKVRTFPISQQIRHDMKEDLRKIGMYLVTKHTGHPMRSTTNRQRINDLLTAPWRYKHQPSSERKPRNPGT
jgi:hypothetical protein